MSMLESFEDEFQEYTSIYKIRVMKKKERKDYIYMRFFIRPATLSEALHAMMTNCKDLFMFILFGIYVCVCRSDCSELLVYR